MHDRPLLFALAVAIACYCCGRPSEAEEPTPRVERVRSVLEQMPTSSWDRDESAAERDHRLDLVAHAIDHASKTDADAAALLAIGGMESAFAGYVIRGCNYPDGIPKGAGHCDRGNSRSPWQMKRVACRSGWAQERGSEAALQAFATCARKHFWGNVRRCSGRHPGGRLAGGFAGYRGVDCTWEGRPHDGARARARVYGLRLGQLASVVAE